MSSVAPPDGRGHRQDGTERDEEQHPGRDTEAQRAGSAAAQHPPAIPEAEAAGVERRARQLHGQVPAAHHGAEHGTQGGPDQRDQPEQEREQPDGERGGEQGEPVSRRPEQPEDRGTVALRRRVPEPLLHPPADPLVEGVSHRQHHRGEREGAHDDHQHEDREAGGDPHGRAERLAPVRRERGRPCGDAVERGDERDEQRDPEGADDQRGQRTEQHQPRAAPPQPEPAAEVGDAPEELVHDTSLVHRSGDRRPQRRIPDRCRNPISPSDPMRRRSRRCAAARG